MEDNKFGQHDAELKLGLTAVSSASKITRKIQASLCADDILTKKDSSPVTIADFAAQSVINGVISHNFSKDINMVAEEESANLKDQKIIASILAFVEGFLEITTDSRLRIAIDYGKGNRNPQKFWTLDPIDGTKGFIRGQQYSISLAYIENGEIKVGILGCPNLNPDCSGDPEEVNARGSLLFAVKGLGAWSTSLDNPFSDCQPVFGNKKIPLEKLRLCESVEAAHSKHSLTKTILKSLNIQNKSIKLDSQVKYAVVARGQGHIYLRVPTSDYYKEKIWDHAAGYIIAEEAGLRVSDINGKKLNFSCGDELKNNKGIVCTHKEHHELIIRSIKNYI